MATFDIFYTDIRYFHIVTPLTSTTHVHCCSNILVVYLLDRIYVLLLVLVICIQVRMSILSVEVTVIVSLTKYYK